MMKDKRKLQQEAIRKKPPTIISVKEEQELMPFLIANLNQKSRDNIKSLLRNRQVAVCGRAVTQYNFVLKPGDEVSVNWNRIPEEKHYKGLKIVFEDRDLIVIDKGAGMLSVATDDEKQMTAYRILSNHVKEKDSLNKIWVVHRLDRDTSGLMLFAKSEEVKILLQKDWNDTIIERTYVAIVEGIVEDESGTIESYLFESSALIVHSSQNPEKGQKAITHYKKIKSNTYYSQLELNLETGRKNQIRVHMKDIGHCIVGDRKYGAAPSPIRRLALHAKVLSFIHPVSGKKMRFESNIPAKFKHLV
jgi:23S rRNA pseudouridine1911/1915/1917 synthase